MNIIFMHIYVSTRKKHIHRYIYKYTSIDVLTRLPILMIFSSFFEQIVEGGRGRGF